jgi:hypothetical protein
MRALSAQHEKGRQQVSADREASEAGAAQGHRLCPAIPLGRAQMRTARMQEAETLGWAALHLPAGHDRIARPVHDKA